LRSQLHIIYGLQFTKYYPIVYEKIAKVY